MNNGTAKAGIIIVVLLLVAALVGTGVLFLRRGSPAAEIIISTPEPDEALQVYVEGAVANPGLYPWREGQSLEDALRAAGGATANADLSKIKIYVPQSGEANQTKTQSRKININTADVKLLDSLPGIGPKRAQDIIDYRTRNGPFHTIRDITKIKGIGPITYEKLKDLITVAD